ncbi:MAG: hypothetical protein QM501_09020 [Gimesia sp.]
MNMEINKTFLFAVLALCWAVPQNAMAGEQKVGGKFDYPTAVRADYVFACMATNGQTRETLAKCSCSIDAIAKVMPYELYERAETIMRMQLAQGQRSAMFKNLPWMVDLADKVKQLQAQSTLECF